MVTGSSDILFHQRETECKETKIYIHILLKNLYINKLFDILFLFLSF